jgi:hypothetical protein
VARRQTTVEASAELRRATRELGRAIEVELTPLLDRLERWLRRLRRLARWRPS